MVCMVLCVRPWHIFFLINDKFHENRCEHNDAGGRPLSTITQTRQPYKFQRCKQHYHYFMLDVVESDTSRMSNIRQGNLRYVQIRPTKQQCDNYEKSAVYYSGTRHFPLCIHPQKRIKFTVFIPNSTRQMKAATFLKIRATRCGSCSHISREKVARNSKLTFKATTSCI